MSKKAKKAIGIGGGACCGTCRIGAFCGGG